MRLQIAKVNPDGVMSSSYLVDMFPTVLTKMSPRIVNNYLKSKTETKKECHLTQLTNSKILLFPLPATKLNVTVSTKETKIPTIPRMFSTL